MHAAVFLLIGARLAAAFGLDDVAARARQLADAPYAPAKSTVPDWLLKITYDQWRDIRFRPDHALWRDRGLPFQVQFFHPGLYYDRSIRTNIVEGDAVRRLDFSPASFDYGKNSFASKLPPDLGYAGFRVHYPLKRSDYYDEVIVFLGASYFRAVSRDVVYGLSARGLAIDTAVPSGEEFPSFTEFWLEQPAPDATHLVIYALLDSPRASGAYRFDVHPGEQTTVDVEARVFLRAGVERLGIAPLTSMFFFGETGRAPFDDFRPEVHDSDGLLLHFDTDEWLWRPLDNPASIQVNTLQMHNPRGFGLIQRDRDFDHYQDLEARSDLRPSVWISPRGDWGDGAVTLIGLPTPTEKNDNIVAFWTPRTLPAAGEPLAVAYTMSWYGADASRPPGGRAVATRRDHGTEPGAQRFVIDFAGGQLERLGADAQVRGVISVASGADAADIVGEHVLKNPVTGGWRLAFHVRPKRPGPVELRAFLQNEHEVLTETWSYVSAP